MQDGGSHLHPRSGQGPLPNSDQGAAQSTPFALSKDAYLLTTEEVIRELNTDPDHGLTEAEAKERLAKAGPNELAGGGGVSIARILAGQIFNAMVLVSAPHAAILNSLLTGTGSDHGNGCVLCYQVVDRSRCRYGRRCRQHCRWFLPGV